MHVGKVITIETPVGCHRDKSPSCVSFPYILFVLSKVTSLFLLLSFISFFFFMGGGGGGEGCWGCEGSCIDNIAHFSNIYSQEKCLLYRNQ